MLTLASKAGKHWYQQSLMNKGKTLKDVYKKPSYNKIEAYNWCINYMEEFNGYNGHITSANQQVFSFSFNYKDEDGIEHIMYLTRDNNYDIKLIEENKNDSKRD